MPWAGGTPHGTPGCPKPHSTRPHPCMHKSPPLLLQKPVFVISSSLFLPSCEKKKIEEILLWTFLYLQVCTSRLLCWFLGFFTTLPTLTFRLSSAFHLFISNNQTHKSHTHLQGLSNCLWTLPISNWKPQDSSTGVKQTTDVSAYTSALSCFSQS